MTYSEAARAIRERFAAGMQRERPDVSIAWPNVSRDVPAGPWVSLAIQPADGRQVEVGGVARYTGSIIIQVFTEQGEGDGEAWGVADAVKAALKPGADGGVLYRHGYVDNVGEDGQGWHQVNVTIPFQFDHP